MKHHSLLFSLLLCSHSLTAVEEQDFLDPATLLSTQKKLNEWSNKLSTILSPSHESPKITSIIKNTSENIMRSLEDYKKNRHQYNDEKMDILLNDLEKKLHKLMEYKGKDKPIHIIWFHFGRAFYDCFALNQKYEKFLQFSAMLFQHINDVRSQFVGTPIQTPAPLQNNHEAIDLTENGTPQTPLVINDSLKSIGAFSKNRIAVSKNQQMPAFKDLYEDILSKNDDKQKIISIKSFLKYVEITPKICTSNFAKLRYIHAYYMLYETNKKLYPRQKWKKIFNKVIEYNSDITQDAMQDIDYLWNDYQVLADIFYNWYHLSNRNEFLNAVDYIEGLISNKNSPKQITIDPLEDKNILVFVQENGSVPAHKKRKPSLQNCHENNSKRQKK